MAALHGTLRGRPATLHKVTVSNSSRSMCSALHSQRSSGLSVVWRQLAVVWHVINAVAVTCATRAVRCI
jgi:hypothetical protein